MLEPEGIRACWACRSKSFPLTRRLPGKPGSPSTTARTSTNRNLIDGNDEAALLSDESKVPVDVIAVVNDEAAGLEPADFEVVGEKLSYRLAQRPGSYVILKDISPVIKLRAEGALSCPPAPVGVLDGRRADVGLIAG
jgi:transposase